MILNLHIKFSQYLCIAVETFIGIINSKILTLYPRRWDSRRECDGRQKTDCATDRLPIHQEASIVSASVRVKLNAQLVRTGRNRIWNDDPTEHAELRRVCAASVPQLHNTHE